MKSPKDGKRYNTDVADTEQLLRIIQSIPSPKAEPFKLWLAQVGRERIEETIDPELTIERALETYLKKGYTREWINQRLQAIQVRKELFDVTKREQRQRLIDSFVNAVYLYEDKIILTFNYKDGSKTITLAEVEGSDLSVLGAP